jgi:5'-deoxynucleotidase YfbR-like HD superfamily hydrolase
MSQGIDQFGCINNEIKVAAGHYVDLQNPKPETIDIFSIASALSKICRFGGHCPRFYSVAEHCVHAARLCASKGYATEAVGNVLMHDSAEAYIGDMVKPLKIAMDEYMHFEKKIEKAVQRRFGLKFDLYQNVIKRFDRIMLKVEKVNMWPQDKELWAGFAHTEDVELDLNFWTPDEAKDQFLQFAKIWQVG